LSDFQALPPFKPLALPDPFVAAAFVFDLVIVAGIVGEGWRHFGQPVLWLAYVLLAGIPWFVGRTFGASNA